MLDQPSEAFLHARAAWRHKNLATSKEEPAPASVPTPETPKVRPEPSKSKWRLILWAGFCSIVLLFLLAYWSDFAAQPWRHGPGEFANGIKWVLISLALTIGIPLLLNLYDEQKKRERQAIVDEISTRLELQKAELIAEIRSSAR